MASKVISFGVYLFWCFFSFVVFTKSELSFFGVAVEVRGTNPFLI
ncbi:hypothetical protein VPUCM_1470 [Vibrio parahaemolyticus UCM-V493]|nr:hypothetical protein VPUCM_1470 [Vibrio parahaemolyticus UCM-V493]